MKKSESIKNIAGALNSLHSEMGKVKKDASNPFFNSKYSTLEAVSDVSREPLIKNNLVITQTVDVIDGVTVVETTLIHADTGEFISSSIPVINKKDDMQGLGSAITYARRYGLAAILGIVQEDDDGNGAGKGSNPPKKKQGEGSQTPGKISVNDVLGRISKIETESKYKEAVEWFNSKADNYTDAEIDRVVKALDDKGALFASFNQAGEVTK